MTAATSSLRQNRKSSIDTEPLTLTIAELQYARKEAMYVMSTKTSEEAVDIFLKGLKPVESIKHYEDFEDDEEEEMVHCVQIGGERRPWNACMERDVVTAPF